MNRSNYLRHILFLIIPSLPSPIRGFLLALSTIFCLEMPLEWQIWPWDPSESYSLGIPWPFRAGLLLRNSLVVHKHPNLSQVPPERL